MMSFFIYLFVYEHNGFLDWGWDYLYDLKKL